MASFEKDASSTEAKLDISGDRRNGGLDIEKLRRKLFDVSGFDINAILRGAQLTLVGAHRALQNPDLFTSRHYQQAAYAVATAIVIRLVIAIPIFAIRILISLLSLIFRLDNATWDNTIIGGLNFIEEHVLQVPLFLMSMMRYITPTLDEMFMDSLKWVDFTYVQKHKGQAVGELRNMYYPNLSQYPTANGSDNSSSNAKTTGRGGIKAFIYRYARKAAVSLVVFGASYLPVVGRFVLPAASMYAFKEAVGLGPSSAIFAGGIILPRRYMVIFLQTYFSSRGLVRELLEPYFARVHLTGAQKRRWFRSREGLLFGFGVCFYLLVKVPLLGVLIYGVAEASTAYLVTKITDPPPPMSDRAAFEAFAERQQEWRNKHEFLSLPLANLDSNSRTNTQPVKSARK